MKKKDIILSSVAALLLIGGVVLIAPMFSSNPGGDGDSGLTTTSGGSASGEGGESVFDRYADQPLRVEDKPSGESIVSYMASEEYAKSSSADQQAYRATIIAAYSDPREAPDEQAMGRGMRAMQEVPEEQREELQQDMRKLWMEVMSKRFENFFALDKDEQMSILDDRIDQSVEREARMKAWMAENPDNPWVKRIKSHISGAAEADGRTDERVERHMQWGMAFTSPATRARMSEAGRMMDARRAERGIAPSMFGSGFGHGGGRGRR
jgi:hypothetical protein